MSANGVRSTAMPRDSIAPAFRLLLISFLSLYFELTLIRWTPTQVRLLAYFTNFVLIAVLLGLGVGMLLAVRRARLALYFPTALLILVCFVVVLERKNLVLPIVTQGQFFWGYIYHLPAPGVVAYLVLIAFFLLLVLVALLIGQETGRALRGFRPLVAYSINIAGSLLGVLGFALVNRLEAPPTVWFAIGAAGFVLYLLLTSAGHRTMLLTALPLLAVVGVIYADAPGGETYWSPYYQIQVAPLTVSGQRVGNVITVNKDSLQFPMDLSGRFHRLPYIASQQRVYNLPYTFSRHPKRILVLGAGSGNDVAAALRNAPGATVDAVEIDPVVARLGTRLHPEHPYSNPRVHLHVTDARSFLQQTSAKYDLIVFGKLDSHRVFSHMSSVRMDNYVYTRQDLENVRSHLTPQGIVAIGFVVHEKWIADRIFTLIATVFQHPPLVYQSDRNAFDTLFFTGTRSLQVPHGAPTISRTQFVHHVLRGMYHETWLYSKLQGFVSPTSFVSNGTLLTDDWPYLYMRERTVPANYLIVLILTVIVSVLLIWFTVPRIDFGTRGNWNFLVLGAGFALQETKGITDVALLFGSTWITNIIVISAILLVILIANLAVSRFPRIPLLWVYSALVITLVFNYLVPLDGLLSYSFWIQVVASGLRVAGPLFFSGIVFAHWFARAENPSSALGANLMGAVMGGLCEYSSLALGLRDLYLIAIAFYGMSFLLGSGPPLRGLRDLTQMRSWPVLTRS